MTDRLIAYVMEQTLGSVTHYLNLRRAENASVTSRPYWLPIEFDGGVLPWTFTGSWRARRAIGEVLNQVDGVFIHTLTLAPLVADYFRKRPTILSGDGTPLNKREMRAAYGMRSESMIAQHSKRALFRGVFAQAAGFVAWSHWAKRSFVEDYNCREQDVAVIPPGVDLEQFSSGDRNHELPRILFVGGDFVRKGGRLLLDVFRRRLLGRAELVIVTREAGVYDEPGVRVHRNVEANSQKLRELYGSSDIFALPTRADCYSLVCMEALASGLPIVATRVGGIPDLIQEGETGHLIEADDGDALGDRLEELVTNGARRQQMSLKSRASAERDFDCRIKARELFEFVSSHC